MVTVHMLEVSTAFYKNVTAQVACGIYPTKGNKPRKSETWNLCENHRILFTVRFWPVCVFVKLLSSQPLVDHTSSVSKTPNFT